MCLTQGATVIRSATIGPFCPKRKTKCGWSGCTLRLWAQGRSFDFAMASKRAHSEPRPNPFWSERTMAEFELESRRPLDLPKSSFTPNSGLPPVPQDEWDIGGSTPRPVQDLGKGKGQSSKDLDAGDKSMEGKSLESGSFKTPPSSWQQHSEGRMPSREREYGTKTEGPQPETQSRLERALEEEMFLQLWKENKALKEELEACKKRDQGETSSWSAVSSAEQVRTPRRRANGEGNLRYTPGGTQVPPFTPPTEGEQVKPQPPPVPPFPQIQDSEHYEVAAATRLSDRSMALGARSWAPSSRGWGDNGEWTEWQLREAAREINRRAVRPDDYWRSDKELGEVKPQVPPPVGHHWNRVFCPGTVMDSSAVFGEVRHQGRAPGVSSALHGEVCHHDRAFGASSAALGEVCHHDRAFGASSAVLGEVCHQDRASGTSAVLGEVCHQDRASGTSAVLGEVCHQDRALGTSAVFGEVRPHSRALGASSADLGDVPERDRAFEQPVSYREDPLRHQQLPCRGLCDPMDERRAHRPNERGRDKSPTEGLRSTAPTLPKLPQSGQKYSSVDASDWLAEVRPLIGDLSTMSSVWWDLTLKHVMKSYNQWISATPLERLRQPPPEPIKDPSLNDLQTQRLEQRVTTMLLPCLDEELRKDVIATRSMWPAAILFRILRVFQPGGHSERSILLHDLASPKGCKSPGEALTALRLWKRQRSRAEELGATLPDVLLQVRALDAMCSPFLSKFPQTSFRVSTYRMETHLDERPNDVTLMQFHELLSAEMETLSTNSEVDTVEKPSAKLLQPNGPASSPLKKSSGGDKACKFWGSPEGCKFGKQCKFMHGELEDKQLRCWLCSSLNHRRSDCPSSKKLDGGSGGAGGTSNSTTNANSGPLKTGKGKSVGEGGSGKSGGKSNGKSQGSSGKKEENGSCQEDPKVASSSPTTETTTAKPPKETEGGPPTQPSTGETELVNEVTSLLRSLSASVKVCSIRKIADGGDEMVLLDGGATHCLRTVASELEWENATDIKVSLAEGETMMKQVTSTKTLITREKVQAIVPLCWVATLGYRVVWSQDGCKITHPNRPQLPVKMIQGCPTVPKQVGMKLLAEVEQLNVERSSVKAALNTMQGKGDHPRFDQLRQLFPQVPIDLLHRIPGNQMWSSDRLPWNRRRRRKLEKAKKLIVYAFSGPDATEWTDLEDQHTAVLCLDVLQGVNLLDNDVAGWIEHLITCRQVDLWISSPPCRTVSVCRNESDGGPPPLRGDQSIDRFGLEGLSMLQREQVDQDSVLWLRNLFWMKLAFERSQGRMQALIEQPRDPNLWCPNVGTSKYPSFLRWPETKLVARNLDLDQVQVDQGRLQHATKKPTTLLSSVPELKQLHEMYETTSPDRPSWPSDVKERIARSKSLAAWAPGLKKLVKEAINRIKAEVPVNISKLSMNELEEIKAWQSHVAHGHCPYRRDCSICVEARGRDRPHRHQVTTEGFCLSLDISGPFSAGVDQDSKKPQCKYFLTGVITIPTSGENPLVQGLRELGMACKESQAEGDKDPLPSSTSTARHRDVSLVTAESGRGESPRIAAAASSSEDQDIFAQTGPDPPDELSRAEVREADLIDQKWKEYLQGQPSVDVANLSQSVPLCSRKPKDVIAAASWIVTRLKSMAIPITRVHTDRAKEFLSKEFRGWVQSKEALQTTTSGNEPQSNSRAEGEINLIKGLTRTLMRASQAPSSYWPLALRCASETRFRRQLQGFGVPTPVVIPFGTRAVARQKLWHKTDPWSNPNTPVRLWGPATDMSITSQGYYAETNDGKFVRTTAFVVPKWQAQDEPLQAVQIPPPVRQNPEVLDGDDHQPQEDEPGEEIRLDLDSSSLHSQGEPELVTHLEIEVPEHQPEALSTKDLSDKRQIPRRLHFKQSVPSCSVLTPALFRLSNSAGGEERFDNVVSMTWEEFADQVGASCTTHLLEQSWQELETWMLFQHRNLGLVLQDFVSEIQSEDLKNVEEMELFQQVAQERRDLEAQLKSMQKQSHQPSETPEVLQTKTISMQELRANPHDWTDPFREEYMTLCRTVIEPLTPSQARDAISRATHVERVPGKLVATIKPPAKKKGRIVACGNFTEASSSTENSAGGIDSITIRSVLRLAADRHWQVSVCDVHKAFLNAPRLEHPGHLTLVDPPHLLRVMEITQPGEVWRIKGALYGFCESPRDWGVHRDATCRDLSWHLGDDRMYLKESEERHLWKVCRNSDHIVEGYLCIYVDDLMAVGSSQIVDSLMSKLQSTWECSAPETVELHKSVRYCGYELQRLQSGGIKLWQPSYTQELLNKHGIDAYESHPCPKIEQGDDESFDLETLRAAQAVTGELQWLQGRTRPDLCYVIGCMSRWLHRRPSYVIQLGQHVLRYLNRTKDFSMWYEPSKEADWGENGVLQVPRSMSQLEIYIDSSFAVEHEQSRSVSGIVIEWCGSPIQWFSCRQPFITASTGESELLGYSEGHQQAESVGALLTTLGIQPNYVIYGDSKSALALATQESGPWRTRHLRIRAHRLREALRCDGPVKDNMTWSARHMDGSALVADGFTKALLGQMFHRFAVRLGLHGSLLNNGGIVEQPSVKASKPAFRFQLQTWVTKLFEAALLMIKGSGFLQRCGRLLLMLVSVLAVWVKKKENHPQPRLCAFRPAQGDQLPIRPSRGPRESQARQRGEVLSGYAGSQLQWLSNPDFQAMPRGKDRWVFMENDTLLVRVHGEERRRCFQPVHRSCPVDVLQRLKPTRHTLVFPVANPVQEVQSDTWDGATSWTKDFRWKGFTVFELKPADDLQGQSSTSGASVLGTEVESGSKSYGTSTSSKITQDRTGINSGASLTSAPVFNVNIHVTTTVTDGRIETRTEQPSARLVNPDKEDDQSDLSDFEFVSEDEK